MKTAIGTKVIEFKPMNLGEYNEFQGWTIPANEDPKKEGYLVKYSDDYISWSPKEAFEGAFREIDNGTMDFGMAVHFLKQGKKVARLGWNGKGMFVFKQVPSNVGIQYVPNMQSLPQSVKDEFVVRGKNIEYCSQMCIVKSDNTIDSWVASSSDTFAEDWFVVD